MTKKVAVLAVNPVNGFDLSQYLGSLFKSGILYRVFTVSGTWGIKTNSGITLFADDVIANLKGYKDEFSALIFACSNVVPVLEDSVGKAYNVDLMGVIEAFGEKDKLTIGHCVAAMMFNFTGIIVGKRLAVRPLAKPVAQTGQATDGKSEIDGNFHTAQGKNTLRTMMSQLVGALKK